MAHDVDLGADNLHLLDGVSFAFLSLDAGDAKRLIVEKLEATGAAFVDVGMGLELDEGSLGGILRLTASTPEKRDHAREHISFAGGGRGGYLRVEHPDEHRSSTISPNVLRKAFSTFRWSDATSAHSCCCGCGEEVVAPLTPTDWKMTFDGETTSLRPSIGNWTLKFDHTM